MSADVLIDSCDGESRQFLWAATFTKPGEGQLERYYGSFGILADGRLCGMFTPKYHPLYGAYRTVSEFADTATQLVWLEKFNEFRSMWYDALQAALKQATAAMAGRQEVTS